MPNRTCMCGDVAYHLFIFRHHVTTGIIKPVPSFYSVGLLSGGTKKKQKKNTFHSGR